MSKDVSFKSSANIQEIPIPEDKVPIEIKSMTDHKSVELYLQLLESGSEKKRDIRLVSVGEKGTGKTSLIKKLFGEDITGNNKKTEIHGRLLKPFEERRQQNVIVEPAVEGADIGGMDNIPSTVDREPRKLEAVFEQPGIVKPKGISISKVNPPGITASDIKPSGINAPNVNPLVASKQSHQPIEQAKRDIETMLTDKSKVDLKDKEDYATLLLWDFAGDEEFYHTHQTFLSPDAIYLVVAKLNEAHDKKAQEMFQLWMHSIHCYCITDEQKNKAGSDEGKNICLEPPVVLVGSHKDKLEPTERQQMVTTMRSSLCDITIFLTCKD
ncbi:unnamed protein product [Mytilus edulis]|uniref:Roc domain-containing protein n=1 Tax=Mytilus edulis TaxID=6550 RepID=A0A8S3V7L4_MYTED|nr:unnamed protein product [Mytilus edulis]